MDTSAASFPEHFDFRAHDAFVRRLALGLLRDGHDADDAAQDAWLAAIQHAPHEAGALRNWLAHVTKNFALRSLTSRAARRRREEIVASEHSAPNVHDMVAREEIRQQVFAAAVALEEPYRTVILLRYFSNLPPRAIAQRLGVPVETVRTRQKRGIELVRARLVGDRGDTTEIACTIAAIAGLTIPSILTIPATLTTPSGVLAFMTTKTKFAAAAIIVLLLSVVIWMLSRPVSESTDPVNQSLQKANVIASASKPVDVDLKTASRTAAATTPLDLQLASKPVVDRDTGTLIVHVLWNDDKKPAVGVQAQVIPLEGSNPTFNGPRVTTDATGSFRIDNLLPGIVSVQFDRSSGTSSTITAGKITEETFTFRESYNIDGIVINAAGVPVARADIILSQRNWDAVIGASDSDGRFTIRGVEPRSYTFKISARADGYAPTKQESVESKAGSNISFKLVFPGPGGGIAGRALDTNGKPVSKARVTCYPYKTGGDGKEQLHRMDVPRLFTDTGPDGTYRLDGLQPGTNRVMARIAGYSVFKTTIEIPETGAASLDLLLEPGVTVSGTVTDSDGKLAKNVKLSVGKWIGFDYHETTTSAEGNYVLRDLTGGEIKINADHRDLGKAFISLTAASGSEVSWNPALSFGLSISGRVVDESGNPVKNCNVMASSSEPTQDESYAVQTNTDANGRFIIRKLENVKHMVFASGSGNMDRTNISDVKPGGPELEILLKSKKHDCYIIGKVVGADGMPMNNIELAVRNTKGDRWNSNPADFKTGEFKMGPYPVGRFRLVLTAKDYPELVLPFHELKSGETWDAGLIKLQKGGKLCVMYTRPKNTNPHFSILDSDEEFIRANVEYTNELPEPSARTTDAIPPGNYQLVVSGGFTCLTSIPFTIPANGDAVLSIATTRGMLKAFVFKLPKLPTNPKDSGPLKLIFQTKSGLRIARVDSWKSPESMEYPVNYSFPPGEYQFEASCAMGKASGVFTVTESDKVATEVILE